MSYEDISPRAFNQLFTQKLSSAEGVKEAEAVGAAYIRDIIREEGFLRRIIPPERVTEADCQRSTEHDTLVKIVDIEPDSRAAIIPFKGEPTINYVQGARVAVPFYMVASERFKKTEQELRAYEYPVKKVIERNTVRDIQSAEDSRFITAANAAITANPLQGIDLTLSPSTINANNAAFSRLFRVIDSNRRRAEILLISDPVFDDYMANNLQNFGDQLVGEVTKDGYKYNTLLGRKVITSNKTNILTITAGAPDTTFIYAFASPEFLGKYYTLGDIQFYVDKRANLIEWQAWVDEGAAIINQYGVSRGKIALRD